MASRSIKVRIQWLQQVPPNATEQDKNAQGVLDDEAFNAFKTFTHKIIDTEHHLTIRAKFIVYMNYYTQGEAQGTRQAP
jgi:hypothetical protein